MKMRFVMDLPTLKNDPSALAQAKEQGFPTVEAVVQHLADFFRTAPLRDDLRFHASELLDEQGNIVRRDYEGMVGARWTDGLGNTVLGITNGDEITVLMVED